MGHDSSEISAWNSARKPEQGFSLLELCITLAILLIVGAMVFVNAATAMRNIRLHQSAVSYANLLQQARIRAVKDDNFYTVQTALSNGNWTAYVDINNSGTYDAGEPMMIFSQGVNYMPTASGPGQADLESKFLPANQSGTVNLAGGPSFGARGLPCKPATGGGVCPYTTPAPGGAVATSYITFLQNAQNTKWEAVTVSPAGRTRVWSYDGTTWSAMN
jgi:prepilin-type N-terminal cleavage/methylation domain-containing protein